MDVSVQLNPTTQGGLPAAFAQNQSQLPTPPPFLQASDTVSLGSQSISTQDAAQVIVDKALEKLRQVVGDARAALGLTEDSPLDTSPEATANRILNFALGSFEHFVDNHPELEVDEARQAFAELIGDAIDQGIREAREILDALNAVTPEVESLIDSISSIVHERLEAFAAGGTVENLSLIHI